MLDGKREIRKSCWRIEEWGLAIVLTMIGFHTLFDPYSLSHSRLQLIANLLTVSGFYTICILIGTVRIYALATAGLWRPWCSWARSVCAAISGLIWLQLATSLWAKSGGNFGTPGMWMYLGAAGMEGAVVLRALAESISFRRSANGRT